jgi:asparagine N-glycosylation enzyme membrane subunit Stt3
MQKKPLTVEDLLRTPGFFLILAALFVFIAAAGLRTWSTIFVGIIMVFSALLSMNLVISKQLEEFFLAKTVSMVLGIVLFFNAIEGLSGWGNKGWFALLLVGGIISLLAAILPYLLERPRSSAPPATPTAPPATSA